VHALRLQGVWQQADQWHAVLGDGLAHVTVQPGQRVGQEGYRVQRIAQDGVVLRADKEEPVLRLDWRGGQP
jgi:Tfp pilus assembly protein PilP